MTSSVIRTSPSPRCYPLCRLGIADPSISSRRTDRSRPIRTRYGMIDTDAARLQPLARAAESQELSRTATDPILMNAFAQIAESYEALVKTIGEENS
jgi:hypothetical protein